MNQLSGSQRRVSHRLALLLGLLALGCYLAVIFTRYGS